jgi:hypothetical protein
MSFNINGTSVFKYATAISAVGLVWFTIISPETANAAAKANGFLIALFASIAAYYYSQYKNEVGYRENEDTYRRFDEAERDVNHRFEEVWRSVNALEDKCCNGSSCPKKGR